MPRIALIQQSAGPDKAANVRRGLEALATAAAQGAKLACFAELAFEPFYPQRKAQPGFERLAEPIPGPTTDAFAAKAKELGVAVVLNLYERAGDRCFDTSPVIDADGRLLGRTRMLHITDYPGFHEQGYYAPGDSGVQVYDTAAGRIGVAICYDRHFPEYMRALALAGAELIVVPQAGTVGEWPEGLYEAELRVAAFQNGVFTALCNRVGQDGDLLFAGESFVCSPDGEALARAGSGTEEILCADLDYGAIPRSHAKRLFFQHRRPELYAEWFKLRWTQRRSVRVELMGERKVSMNPRISVDPQIHFGKPCVKGTRIPVQNVLELVREQIPFHDITRDYYPDLTVEDIRACVQHALDIVSLESVQYAVA